MIIADFNNPPSTIDKATRQKIRIYKSSTPPPTNRNSLTFIEHPTIAGYTFFLNAHRTFSRIDHMLDHKAGLSKFKKTEIVSSIFSNHNAETRNQLQEKNCKKPKRM